MPVQSISSLDTLRAQARLTYRYWPIYLMLRLREAEQHLTPDQKRALRATVGSTGSTFDRSRLITYGLWDSDLPLPKITPPPPLPFPVGARRPGDYLVQSTSDSATLWFEAELHFNGDQPIMVFRLPLLRAPLDEFGTLQQVAEQFIAMTREWNEDVVLSEARLWAALHGARALDFQVSSRPVNASSAPPALPPRKRGRGSFRSPFSS